MDDIIIAVSMFGSTAFILWKYFDSKHKERMAIIDRGMVTSDLRFLYNKGTSKPNRYWALKWGLAGFLIGLALLISIPMQQVWGYDHQPEIIIGMIFLGGGFGFLLYYFLVGKNGETPS